MMLWEVALWFWFIISLFCFVDIFADLIPTPKNSKLEDIIIVFYLINIFIGIPICLTIFLVKYISWEDIGKLGEIFIHSCMSFWSTEVSISQILLGVWYILFGAWCILLLCATIFFIKQIRLCYQKLKCPSCNTRRLKKEQKFCSRCGVELNGV